MVPETLPGQIYLEKLPFAFGHPRWYSGKSIRLQCRNILQFLRHVTPTLSIPLKCVGMRWAVTDAHEFCEHRFPLNYLRCTPRMTAPPEEEHSVSSTLCSALTGCHAVTPPLHWGLNFSISASPYQTPKVSIPALLFLEDANTNCVRGLFRRRRLLSSQKTKPRICSMRQIATPNHRQVGTCAGLKGVSLFQYLAFGYN